MKHRILVVDDESDFSGMLKLSLEMNGTYQVREENVASAAVRTAADFRPDVVIMDLMMPEMDGAEVAAAMREEPGLKETPVIFLTALVGADDAPLGSVASGGQTFLPKPVDLDQLIDYIESKIAGRAAAATAMAAPLPVPLAGEAAVALTPAT